MQNAKIKMQNDNIKCKMIFEISLFLILKFNFEL